MKGELTMTKAEMTERIVDRLVDPWTEDLVDYADVKPIDLEYAKSFLKELRHEDVDMDDPNYCIPEGTTPELLMEVFNCLLRAKQRELTICRLAECITDNELVCEWDNYYVEAHPDALEVLPLDFLIDEFPFKMIDDSYSNPLWLVELGQRSPEFNPNHEYCWFDMEHRQLYSTNTPFHDGIIDAKDFAEWIMTPEGEDCREYFTEHLLSESEREHIFGKGDE